MVFKKKLRNKVLVNFCGILCFKNFHFFQISVNINSDYNMLVYYHYKSLNENFNQVLELRKKPIKSFILQRKKIINNAPPKTRKLLKNFVL